MSDDFPCASIKDAARHLRRPFTQAAVKFKVQAIWPKDNPTGGLIVAYIDARLVVERLNLLVPDLWRDEYRPVGQGQMWCDLTIDGVTRSDVGEGTGKALVSDALKRAAVRFGVGVSLYAIPKMMLDTNSGALKQKRTRDGLTLELTPVGEKKLRESYAQWLEQHGKQAFGDPLDHGDVEGAQGDAEADGNAQVVDEPTDEPATVDQPRIGEAEVAQFGAALGRLTTAQSPRDKDLINNLYRRLAGEGERVPTIQIATAILAVEDTLSLVKERNDPLTLADAVAAGAVKTEPVNTKAAS